MIEISDLAKAKFTEFFADKDIEPIRIYLAMGCGGAQLALALDQAKETDKVVEIDGFTIVIDKQMYEEGKTFSIDASATGFAIHSDLVLPQGPKQGACGSCCGGCG